MDPIWIALAAAAALGLHGGYQSALADACSKVSESISFGASVQSAITPPGSVIARILNWGATIALLMASWYLFDQNLFVGIVLVRVVCAVFVLLLMRRDPPHPILLQRIFISLDTRAARLLRSGDLHRAEAIEDIKKRFLNSPFMTEISRF